MEFGKWGNLHTKTTEAILKGESHRMFITLREEENRKKLSKKTNMRGGKLWGRCGRGQEGEKT